MIHVYLARGGGSIAGKRRHEEEEAGRVHYEGPPLIGSSTLCGVHEHGTWEETTKRVTCVACLHVRDFVLGRLA
jgi:hypothetical protein